MAHVLAEAPAPPVRAPTPAPQPRPRIYEGHAIDAALEQRLSLDAKRKSALDKREALIIRALAAVKRREAAVAERERRLMEEIHGVVEGFSLTSDAMRSLFEELDLEDTRKV